MPRTFAAPKAEARNGSSPKPSTTRPQRGSRVTSTMGEKVQFTPPDRASAADTRASAAATRRVEAGRLRQRRREDRELPVDDVEPDEQRDAVRALFDSGALQRVRSLGALRPEQGADAAASESQRFLLVAAPDDLQLRELLSPRHAGEERFEVESSHEHPIVRFAQENGGRPGGSPNGHRCCAGTIVPGGVHLLEHLVDGLLAGQQALHADAEGVVDRGFGQVALGPVKAPVSQQLADRRVDGVDVVRRRSRDRDEA